MSPPHHFSSHQTNFEPTLASRSSFHIDNKSLLGQHAVGKDRLGFLEQQCLVVIARTIMSKDQATHMRIASHHCRLPRRGVVKQARAALLRRVVGSFMIHHTHPFNQFVQGGNVACVATISVRPRGIGWHGETTIWDDFTFFRLPTCTIFYVVDLTSRNMIEVYHVAPDMWQRRLLTEKVSTAGYAVV